MAKKETKADDIVFTDSTKHKRALGIVGVLNGHPASAHLKSEYSDVSYGGHISPLMELVNKFEAILKDEKIDPKDEPKAVLLVYKKLGGAVTTYEKQEAMKRSLKKNANSKKALAEAEADEDDKNSGSDDDDD